MNDEIWLVEQFETQRSRLRSVAYRMLGSLSEADDAVQETWLRLSGTDASVIKYDFVRPNAQSTTLEAARLGQVWSGKASSPAALGGD